MDKEIWQMFYDTFTDREKLAKAILGGKFASGTEEIKKAKDELAQATALLEKVKDRRKLLMKLLSDPEADIDEKESKQMFAEYKEKSTEAERIIEESTAIIRHPKHVDAVIAKASKLMARELREVDELMLKFATNVEARKLGVPTATMKEHILEQKRNLIKREISNGSSIVYKNGRIFFEGDLAKSKEPVHKMGKSHNGRETKRYH